MSMLINVVLPVFLVAGVAALVHTRLRFHTQTLSRAAFYLFGPALVFDSLATSKAGGTEFEADSPFAALCVLVTTLVSLPTITVLLNLLSGG